MAVTMWLFMLEPGGELKRVPVKRWQRLWNRADRMPERAGEELKVIEIILEVDRRVVERVIRVLPYRMPVRLDGTLDVATHGRIASERVSLAFGPDFFGGEPDMIRQLELDASYFWELGDEERAAVARAVQSQPEDIVRASWRPHG